jgi:hypothetical protein
MRSQPCSSHGAGGAALLAQKLAKPLHCYCRSQQKKVVVAPKGPRASQRLDVQRPKGSPCLPLLLLLIYHCLQHKSQLWETQTADGVIPSNSCSENIH